MNRRVRICALVIALSLASGCEQCPPPGCDTCSETCSSYQPCGTCVPCARPACAACESMPAQAPETRNYLDEAADLRSADRATRERAVDALARRGTSVLPQIEVLLSDPDASVRFSALQVLVRLRRDAWPSVHHVKYRLADADPAIRAEAAYVIGLTGKCGAAAIPELSCALDDTSSVVRYRAAVAFQKMEELGEPARDAIERHSRCDRDPRVREACRCAIYLMDEAICRQPDVPRR